MRVSILAPALALLLPQMGSAHVGHIAEVAGHSHWVAGAAIGLAVLVGLWGKHKDRQEEGHGEGHGEGRAPMPQDTPEETEPAEAQA